MVVQELMQGGLLGASLPQPVEDCLNVVGRMLCGGPGHGAVMSSTWQPMDVLKKSTSGGTKVPSLLPLLSDPCTQAADVAQWHVKLEPP